MEYISQSYITLMLLAGLTVILIANRRTKIQGTQFVWAIMGLVLTLTVCEYLEYWCDTYDKPLWILYLKTTLVYWIYPLIILLELYLIAPIKHKFWALIPYAVYAVTVALDFFGFGMIYSFNPNHSFNSGNLHSLPTIAVSFYLIMLMIYSPEFIRKGNRSKTTIMIFMVCSTILTSLLELKGIIVNHVEEIIAIDMLIYYFYLAAIHHSEVQAEFYQKELELEQSNNALLMAQIQPHFIYNSLMAIRSQCGDNPEVYQSISSFSRYLRSNLEALGDTSLITFAQELQNIKAYLSLEQLNFKDRLKIEYDIECDDFLIPALSVQPLVENAVSHGIGTYTEGGLVKIIVREENDGITIEVIDNGSGKRNISENQKKRKSIGIQNVRARLHTMSKGELEIISDENGTCARITLTDIQCTE